MNTIRTGSPALICCLMFGACASVPPGPDVAVMPPPGEPVDQFRTDDVVRRQWAEQQSGTTAQRAAGVTTAERAGIGAAVGAGAGVLGGTTVRAREDRAAAAEVQRRYNAAYAVHVREGKPTPGRVADDHAAAAVLGALILARIRP